MSGDLRTILVTGSHGSLRVHVLSGHIIERDNCDCADCLGMGYATIKWFDPAAWCPCCIEAGHADILGTAFVDQHGYCQELAEVSTRDGFSEYVEWAWPFPALPAPNVSICLHAWKWEDDGDLRYQTYADGGGDQAGWCVYTRHDAVYPDPQIYWRPFQWQPFDTSKEQDFSTYEEALAEAEKRAAEYGVVVKEY